MALYYFDVRCGGDYYRDEIGDAFDNLREAMAHAQALLPDLARNYTLNEQNGVVCELKDESGEVVYRGELIFRSTNIAR